MYAKVREHGAHPSRGKGLVANRKAADEMKANPKQSEIRYTTYCFITPRSRW